MSKSNLYRCIREFQFTQPKRAATGFKFCPYTDKTVSIHAAQAGCDKGKCITPSSSSLFQFTQPKRAATKSQPYNRGILPVSIHAAQAGCDMDFCNPTEWEGVSIHAAQAGCDDRARQLASQGDSFNSRSPSGLRQGDAAPISPGFYVSIHAAQAGCDLSC